VYGCLLGPIALFLGVTGGLQWANVGIIFIYYTQFLLYDSVKELYREEGLEEPLNLWWTLPIPFSFDLIVGQRQVHSLSQYWYRQRGVTQPTIDPVVTFFPFIGADKFTWQEFLTTPSLWCQLTASIDPIDRSKLPPRAYCRWEKNAAQKSPKSSVGLWTRTASARSSHPIRNFSTTSAS
jgi:hypothetical protein